MLRPLLICLAAGWFVVGRSLAAQDPSVEELWNQWRAGNTKAYERLLLDHLDSDRIEVQVKSADLLGRLGTLPNLVVPALAETLNHERATVRAAAATALGRFGGAAEPVSSDVAKTQQDPYLTVRLAAEDAMEAIRQTKDRGAAK